MRSMLLRCCLVAGLFAAPLLAAGPARADIGGCLDSVVCTDTWVNGTSAGSIGTANSVDVYVPDVAEVYVSQDTDDSPYGNAYGYESNAFGLCQPNFYDDTDQAVPTASIC